MEAESPDDKSPESKPWGGRFTEATDSFVEQFSASVQFDSRLYAHDIRGSIAHARMLAQVGVLTADECNRIVAGLDDIRIDIERGEFAWVRELEDVHMNIEARLTDRIGEVGKKLHTGRSRNDQVATDVRLYLRRDRRHNRRGRASRRGAAPHRRGRGRDHHAGLHPHAAGAAGHLRPSPPRLDGDAAA